MPANNVSPDTTPLPSKESASCPGRAACKGDRYEPTESTAKTVVAFELANSTVVIQRGRAGKVARIEREGGIEYAGPLPSDTVDALREVSR